MFCFFINDNFFSFWQNQIGQVFFDLTIKGLNLNSEQVSLNYYSNFNQVPEHFYFDEDKNLIIQEKVISTQDDIEVEEMVIINSIAPVIYAVNGQKVLQC